MNDRFKFRVWDKPLEKYMEFKEFKFMNVEFTFNPIKKEAEIEYDKERYIVEQITGLKDKNGKLIYEGDILGYKDYADKRVVVWDNKYMAYRVHDEDNVDCGSVYQEYVGEFGIQVIGNIHENPELLKDSK